MLRALQGPDRLSWFERHRGVAILGILAAAIFLLSTRTEPLRANWGDPWSDGNAITSGRYFAEDGFVATGMTPILDVGPLDENSLRYTHYPPLPDLVNGAQRALFGPMTIPQFRILADLLSILSLVFFYRFVRRLVAPGVADYAVALVGTNFLWLQYADTLHHVPLYTATGYFALDQVGLWLEDAKRRRLWAVAIAVTLCALASYDFIFYLPIMTAVAIWLGGRRLRERALRPLLAVVVGGLAAAVVIKFALIAWSVGPVHLVHDLIFQFEERATAKHATAYKSGLWPIVLARMSRFFTPLVFVLIVALLWSAWKRRTTGTAPLPLTPLAFLAGGLPFCVLFTQLLVEQFHPTLQLVPFYAVGAATVIVALRQHARRGLRVAGVALFVLLLGWQAREVARFPKVLVTERELAEVGAQLAKTDERRFVLSNFLVDGPVRAYWRRHLMGVPSMTEAYADEYLRDLFARYGSRPIRFVAFSDAPALAYDKLIYALMAGQRRWAWIADPYANRHKIEPKLEKMNEELLEAFTTRATLEFEHGRFAVYRIDVSAGDRGWAQPLADDAMAVDLGDPASIRHKLYGLAASATGPSGQAAARLEGRVENDVRFTMQGLVDEPTGRIDRRAAVQLAVPSGAQAIAVQVAAPAGSTITVTLNGVSLGTATHPGGWHELTFPIVSAAFDEGRRLTDGGEASDIVAITASADDTWLSRVAARAE